MSRIMALLIASKSGGLTFTTKSRGILEGNTTYYNARTTAWDGYMRLQFVCSAGNTAFINWGDSDANGVPTNTIHAYSVAGSGTITTDFRYTSAYDTEPENPALPIASRQAREKTVMVTFSNGQTVTGVTKTIILDLYTFGENGLLETAATSFVMPREYLKNLPPFPPTMRDMVLGNPQNSASPGNQITWQAIMDATVLCRHNIRKITMGVETLATFQSTFYHNVPLTQVVDLTGFSTIEFLYYQGSGLVKLISNPTENPLLKITSGSGPNSTRPQVDFSEFIAGPALQSFDHGSSTVARADTTKTPIDFRQARDLTSINLRFMFVAGSKTVNMTAAEGKFAFFKTLDYLYQALPNLPTTGTRTLNLGDNGSVGDTTVAGYPTGVQYMVTAFINAGWTVTYTA